MTACRPCADHAPRPALPRVGARARRSASSWAAAAWVLACLLSAAGASQARIVEEVVQVAVRVDDAAGKPVAQDIVVTIYRDDRQHAARPLALINHGRPPQASARARMGRVRERGAANWFVRQGFVVVVPTRVGYGASGGPDVEESGDCDHKRYAPAFNAAAAQALAVLNAMRRRADVQPAGSVALGLSFGGVATLALAALRPTGLAAVVNVAGGAGGNPATHPRLPCAPEQLRQWFAERGGQVRVPSAWLYAPNDQYFGADLPLRWFEAFRAGGAPAQFIAMPALGDDGHLFFSRYPHTWQPPVADYLRRHGAWPRPGPPTPATGWRRLSRAWGQPQVAGRRDGLAPGQSAGRRLHALKRGLRWT